MNIVIIAGCTASGKSSVLEDLVEKHGFVKLVTTTTRDPRPGEIDGVHYHFIDNEEFEKRQKNNFFLESVFNKGKYYGTGLDEMEKDFKGKTPAVILDPVGTKVARDLLLKNGYNAKTVFIDESIDTCIERVTSRDLTENGLSNETEKRLKDLNSIEKNWRGYMTYDLYTVPLSTLDENCNTIKDYMDSFKEKIIRKVERKSLRKNNP